LGIRECFSLSRVVVRTGYHPLLDQPLITYLVAVGAGINGFVLLDLMLGCHQIGLLGFDRGYRLIERCVC
jgi:hypothetical protein